MTIVQCPHCGVFRNPENEVVCLCPTSMKVLQELMALIVAEHEKMRERLIELEEIYEDTPIRWRGSGEPIVKLEEEMESFLKEKVKKERRADGLVTNFSNN